MNREQVVALLTTRKPVLTERFGGQRLTVSGSFARVTACEASDVDVLMGYDPIPTPPEFFGRAVPIWKTS